MQDKEKQTNFSSSDESSFSGEDLLKDEVSVEEPGVNGGDSTKTNDESTITTNSGEGNDLLVQERARSEEYYNRLLRMQADFENYRKRVARENEDLTKFANEALIMELLPVIDNFELAFSVQNNDYEKLLAGMEMIHRQLQDILAKEGVETITAVGEPFNPEYHEAVMREETGEHPENTVTAELRRGYTYKGKVIRPTMVKVSG